MTLYFEILKTFAGTGGAERGSWILYGQSDVEGPSHRGAVDAALWPSIRADIVFWAILTELGGA